ncbi:hypothetical protein [Amycolatopsis sp. NPDC102389]
MHPGIAWPCLIFDGDRLVGFLMAFLDIDFAGDAVAAEIRRRGGNRLTAS